MRRCVNASGGVFVAGGRFIGNVEPSTSRPGRWAAFSKYTWHPETRARYPKIKSDRDVAIEWLIERAQKVGKL